jgi:hypothetical protein
VNTVIGTYTPVNPPLRVVVVVTPAVVVVVTAAVVVVVVPLPQLASSLVCLA